uniref:Integrase catalytic domain-containing protein n=1 Tax=Ascaris lumbricoides TaxID=6252 RepID=A0A0M3ILY0_ASCLU
MNSEIKCHLLICKTRLTPLKGSTIRRQELMGALIGTRTRLLEYTSQQLQLESVDKYIWTDSQCTLQRIRSSDVHQKDRFVENRLKEIRKTDARFGYVPSDSNPADIPTRGSDLDDLINNKLWWHGPHWLLYSSEQLPQLLNHTVRSENNASPEDHLETEATTANTHLACEIYDRSSTINNATRFSQWPRLLRTTAWDTIRSDEKDRTKRWICLFTCFSTRAVHLEVASDLSGPGVIQCLRRFVSRRRLPKRMLSDNGTQFVWARSVLASVSKVRQTDNAILDYCAAHNIQWSFITPLAPWQGGIYE